MADGERAADGAKDGFRSFFHATDDIRRNINSFADNLIAGNHANSHIGNASDTHPAGGHKSDRRVGTYDADSNLISTDDPRFSHTTPAMPESGAATTSTTNAGLGSPSSSVSSASTTSNTATAPHTSTMRTSGTGAGAHSETQDKLRRGVDSMGAKLDGWMHRH